MSNPFLGELRIMSFNFAPRGWAMCNGQLLPINQNQALFSLLGTTYGGNGQNNFALPDMRSRTPLHVGNSFVQGQAAGQYSHTLTIPEMPSHVHTAQASSADGDGPAASGALLAGSPTKFWNSPTNLTSLLPGTIANYGGSQPHQNMQPFLTLNFCIALQGIFPSRN